MGGDNIRFDFSHKRKQKLERMSTMEKSKKYIKRNLMVMAIDDVDDFNVNEFLVQEYLNTVLMYRNEVI